MKRFIGILLLVCLVFVTCNNNTEPDNDDAPILPKLAIIDIANATNLFIAHGSNKLFKITDDDNIQQVSYFDEDGKIMTDIPTPSSVYNVNDDYVMIIFSSNEGYLIRKSDGAIFMLPSDCIPAEKLQETNFKNAKIFQTDSNGNIYYQAGNSGLPGIVKINISNPNSIVKTDCLPLGEGATAFAVTPEGHIVYHSNSVSRIRKSNGNLYDMGEGIEMQNEQQFYIGLDGKIKVIKGPTIDIYNIDSEFNVSVDTINSDGGNGTLHTILVKSNSSIIYFHNKIFVITSVPPYGAGASEFESDTPREATDFPLVDIRISGKSDSYIYVSGYKPNNESALVKIDPFADGYWLAHQAIFSNIYDFYHFTVSDNDVIYFAAKNVSNGEKVIGRVSSTGEISVLSTEFETKGIILERIR